jgi:hypothetical protein
MKRTSLGFIGTVSVLLTLMVFAQADEITFKIIKLPDLPLPGSILMKTSDKSWYKAIDVPVEGSIKTNKIKRSLGIYFKAIATLWYVPIEGEKDCHAGEIAFRFKEKTYVASLLRAVNGDLFSEVKAPNEVVSWQKELSSAAQAGDSETILKRSTEIYDYLVKAGLADKAKPYHTLNLDIAKTKISGPGELYYDPDQHSYVLSEQDIANLKNVQETAKIKSDGKLNWVTMGAIGKIDQLAAGTKADYRIELNPSRLFKW